MVAWLNPSVFGLLQLEVHVCPLLKVEEAARLDDIDADDAVLRHDVDVPATATDSDGWRRRRLAKDWGLQV